MHISQKYARRQRPSYSEIWLNNRIKIIKMCRAMGGVSVKVHAPSLLYKTPILFKIRFSRNAAIVTRLPEIQQRLARLFGTDVVVVKDDAVDAKDPEFVQV